MKEGRIIDLRTYRERTRTTYPYTEVLRRVAIPLRNPVVTEGVPGDISSLDIDGMENSRAMNQLFGYAKSLMIAIEARKTGLSEEEAKSALFGKGYGENTGKAEKQRFLRHIAVAIPDFFMSSADTQKISQKNEHGDPVIGLEEIAILGYLKTTPKKGQGSLIEDQTRERLLNVAREYPVAELLLSRYPDAFYKKGEQLVLGLV